MTRRGRGRLAFWAAFVVLLLDGAAATWLGQVSARGLLIGVGLVLMAASAGLALVYRRWQAAMDDVDAARRAVRSEVEALRQAVHDARSGP
ncbi:MAG: hypothetical protein AAB409_03055 [Gemmatimonadota bacterium]